MQTHGRTRKYPRTRRTPSPTRLRSTMQYEAYFGGTSPLDMTTKHLLAQPTLTSSFDPRVYKAWKQKNPKSNEPIQYGLVRRVGQVNPH